MTQKQLLYMRFCDWKYNMVLKANMYNYRLPAHQKKKKKGKKGLLTKPQKIPFFADNIWLKVFFFPDSSMLSLVSRGNQDLHLNKDINN